MNKKFFVFSLVTLAVVGGWGGMYQARAQTSGGDSFSIHNEVFAAETVRVRPTASVSQTALGTRSVGDLGVVVGGPTVAEGYTWWKINWPSDGLVGWSAEKSTDESEIYLDKFTRTFSNKFSLEDNVRVRNQLQVFSAPNVDNKYAFDWFSGQATIVDGPVATGGYTLWKIGYEDSFYRAGKWVDDVDDGWVKEGTQDGVEAYLTKIPRSTMFSTGDRVVVRKGSLPFGPLDVRNFPSMKITSMSSRRYGDVGTIMTGPTQAEGYTWWNIRWNDGTQGWSRGLNGNVDTADGFEYSPLWKLRYVVGDSVRVIYDETNVYYILPSSEQELNNSQLPRRKIGDFGIVVDGPIFVSDITVNTIGNRYVLWKIKWSDGIEGWSMDYASPWHPSISIVKCLTTECLANEDGGISTSTATSTIPTNSPPVISGVTGPTSLTVGTAGNWTVAASDPDGDAFSYSVVWGDGQTSPAQSGSSFTHTYLAAGTYTATFMVRDSKGVSTDKLVRIVVSGGVAQPTSTPAGNRAPVIYDVDGPKGAVTLNAGTVGTWKVSASDPDGDPISYSVDWNDGVRSSAQNGSTFTHTYQSLKTYSAYFEASDGKGGISGSAVPIRVVSPDSSGLPISTRFANGDKIQTTGKVQVRTTAGGTILTPRAIGDKGTIIGGPEYATVSGVGYWWWNVNYDTGADGWSAEDWLVKISSSGTIGGSTSTPTSTFPTNQPPVISSITGPTNVGVGSINTWQFTARDPEGGSLTYGLNWGDGSQIAGGVISSGGSPSPQLHTYLTPGTYTLIFTVTDTGGLNVTKTLTVSTITSAKFMAGDRVQTSGRPQVRVTPGGTALAPRAIGDKGAIAGGPQYAKVDGNGYWWWNVNYDTGSDGWSAEDWLWKINTVSTPAPTSTPPANQPPVISSVAPPASVTTGVAGTWTVLASDPNGDTLNYQATWGDGTASSPQSGSSFAHTYSTAGTYTATFTVGDGKGGGANKATVVSVTGSAVTPSNQPPVIYGVTGPTSLTAGVVGNWNVSASDPNGDFLTYRVAWGDGTAGQSQNAPGFTHAYAMDGTYTVTFTVVDNKSANTSKTVVVIVGSGTTNTPTSTPTSTPTQTPTSTPPANQPPVISSVTSPASLIAGTASTWTVAASDPDNDTLSYSATWGDGQTSSAQSGTSFTHTYATAGFYNMTFTATDTKGESATKALTVTAGSADLPTLSDITGPASLKINTRGDWNVAISNPGSYLLSYVMDWGDGAKVSGSAGTAGYSGIGLNHTYKTTGTYTMTFTVTKSTGESVSKSLTVAATLVMAPSSPSYTASAIQAIQLQLNQVVEQLRLILEQLR